MTLLDATITYTKEYRLCVETQSGRIYLFQKPYEIGRRFEVNATDVQSCWHLLGPLPMNQVMDYLMVLGFDRQDKEPLALTHTKNGLTYEWRNGEWSQFTKDPTASYHLSQWRPPRNAQTLVVDTNLLANGSPPSPIQVQKPRRGFKPFFRPPKPPGKVVDEIDLSFEGALSSWVGCYALLEDGRMFVLAAEMDLGDLMIMLVSTTFGFLIGGVLLIGIYRSKRRKKEVAQT